MDIAAFLVLGLAVGTFGTLIGVGGGFILIPIFLLVMHYSPQHAIGTSIAVVFFNALSGTIAYMKQRKVFYQAAVLFSVATIPGAIAGSYLSAIFSGPVFNIVFGILLILISLIMLAQILTRPPCDIEFITESFSYNRVAGILFSALAGFLSSLLGIGGGIIHVPFLIYYLGFPCHVATATSHFILAISAFFGFSSHLLLGNVLLKPALFIGIGALIGAQLGAYISQQISSRPIVILLSLALTGLGIRLIILQ